MRKERQKLQHKNSVAAVRHVTCTLQTLETLRGFHRAYNGVQVVKASNVVNGPGEVEVIW